MDELAGEDTYVNWIFFYKLLSHTYLCSRRQTPCSKQLPKPNAKMNDWWH